jgi:predicted amidophosphoribosyltransferase
MKGIKMPKQKPKCHKCKEPIDLNAEICYACGAVLTTKKGMLSKKDLKKMKEI